MKITILALVATLCAGQVSAQESGNCLTIAEADAQKDISGDEIVAQINGPAGSILVLVKRADGTFKELMIFAGTVCHIQDFVADPRNASFVL